MVTNSEPISEEGLLGSDGDPGGEQRHQETQPPLSVEEVADLEQKIERGKLVLTLLGCDGWVQILRPYIQNGKQQAINSWRQETELSQFIASRQAYNTLDALQTYLMNIAKQGQAARERLYPEKRRSGDG